MTKLRFAPIIRVSTESQEKKGESLNTQTEQILSYVESLGGNIPEHCWRYKGQESATPDKERILLDQLLQDSEKGIFDAVIVCDASRWSRDNQKSKEGLNILRKNGIKFFIGSTEYDLFDPAKNLFLGMSAEIGEFQALEQARKSIQNRIARAKRGIPSAGYLPFGRTWSEKDGWGIDPEKQNIMKSAAERYLNGEGIPEIAKSFGLSPGNFHHNLTKRCGTHWECRFRNASLKIDETVVFEIPPLLDQKTIDAIKERVRINTTYVRGNRKYEYLLPGFAYCAKCGYNLKAYGTNYQKRYYRHSVHKDCGWHGCIPAAEFENSVLLQLVRTFGDRERIEAAIKRATPDLEKVERLNNEQAELSNNFQKVIQQKNRIIDSIAEATISKEEAKVKMSKLREQEESIKERQTSIETELSSIPDINRVKRSSYWAGKVIGNATKRNPRIIFEKDHKWKRKLIEHAFSGVDNSGKRLGVYVDYVDGKWVFEINGMFESSIKALPLSNEELIEAFHLDGEYQDVEKELQIIKSNMAGLYDQQATELCRDRPGQRPVLAG